MPVASSSLIAIFYIGIGAWDRFLFFFLFSFLFRYFWNGADFWRLIKQTFLPSYLAVTFKTHWLWLHLINNTPNTFTKSKHKKIILAFKTMLRVVHTYAPNLSNENLKSKKSFENLFWACVFFYWDSGVRIFLPSAGFYYIINEMEFGKLNCPTKNCTIMDVIHR